jgi:hypothetical protein
MQGKNHDIKILSKLKVEIFGNDNKSKFNSGGKFG